MDKETEKKLREAIEREDNEKKNKRLETSINAEIAELDNEDLQRAVEDLKKEKKKKNL